MTIWLIETFVWAKATCAPDRRQRTATKTAKCHRKFILVCFMTTLSISQRDRCSFVIFNPRRSHATHRDRNSAGKTTSGPNERSYPAIRKTAHSASGEASGVRVRFGGLVLT